MSHPIRYNDHHQSNKKKCSSIRHFDAVAQPSMSVCTNEGPMQNFHKKKRQRSAGNDAINASDIRTNDDGKNSNTTYGMRPLASIFSSAAANTKNKLKEYQRQLSTASIACVTIDDSEEDNTSEEEKNENSSSSQPPSSSQSYTPKPKLSKRSRAAGGGGGGGSLVLLSSNTRNGCRGRSHRPPSIPSYGTSANVGDVCNETSVQDWGSGRKIDRIPTVVEQEEELWIDKYAPSKMEELVVHRKKIEAVRSWILESMALSRSKWKRYPHSNKLLALVGPSGSGKSAMIKALASEFGIELSQWIDTSGMALPTFREKKECLGEDHSQRRREFHVEYSNQMVQFKEFISHAKYPSLLSSGCIDMGRSEMDPELLLNGPPRSQIVLLEDLPSVQGEEATEELQGLMANFVLGSRHPIVLVVTSDGVAASPNDMVKRILGAEVVYAHNIVKIITINRVATTALRKCLTSVSEREGLINAEGAIESALESSRGDVRNALLMLQVNTRGLDVTSSSKQETCQSIKKSEKRSRIKQQKSASSSNTKRSKCAAPPFVGGGSRDSFLNHFNVLGRLLYRTKEENDDDSIKLNAVNNSSGIKTTTIIGSSSSATAEDIPSHLQSSCFDPGEIIQFSTLNPDRAATFLQYHCIDFFTNVDELALTLGSLSDADLFVAREFGGAFGGHSGGRILNSGGFHMGSYVSGIISRCVAAYNCHPAPSKFRQFSSPKWQDLCDQQRSGTAHMDAFFVRSWKAQERRKGTGWGISRYSREDMALYVVPAARLITGVFQVDSTLEALAHRSDEATGFTGTVQEVERMEESSTQHDVEIEEFD